MVVATSHLSSPLKNRKLSQSKSSIKAHQLFWKTLHSGDYSRIDQAMTLLKAEYLKNPHDSQLAAHIGFLHVWKLSERYRLKEISPSITDHAILSRKYFEEASKLSPEDARFHGFHSVMMMTEGHIHNDEYLKRKGYYQGLDSIKKKWPQFNLFTVGYVLSRSPKPLGNFKKPWRCNGETLKNA